MGVCKSYCKSYIEKKIKEDQEKNPEKYWRDYGYNKISVAIFHGTKALQNNRPYLDLCVSPNAERNLDIYQKIKEENDKLAPLMKAKISELLAKSKNPSNPIVMIGIGNSFNNPIYHYNVSLIKKCPKCGGRVEEDFENGYETKKKIR